MQVPNAIDFHFKYLKFANLFVILIYTMCRYYL